MGECLYHYQMANDEKNLIEELRKECIKICDMMNIPKEKCFNGSPYMGRLKDNHDFQIKYKTGIGYFVLDGERGQFSMREGFPEQNKEKAKFRLLIWEFEIGGFQYELEHRDEFQHLWKEKYKVEYDPRKVAFEYAIQKHIVIFSCFTEEVITKYIDFMNKWFENPHWTFNNKNKLFEEI